MSNLRRPTFEEFAATARSEFRFLETEYGFRESAERKRYSNPFQIRFESDSTLVIVKGVGHGSSASIEVGDREKQRLEFDTTIPVWAFASLAGREGSVITGRQLDDVSLQAVLLRDCAEDVLRGDFTRFYMAEALLAERIENTRESERIQHETLEMQRAIDSAASAFRAGQYESVIARLSPFELTLPPAQKKKLAISNDRKKG